MTDRLRSVELNERLHALVPGGAHTYAKGDDQYPEGMAPVIVRGPRLPRAGRGRHRVRRVRRRAPVGDSGPRRPRGRPRGAARPCAGTNFVRPTALEAEVAEAFDLIDAARHGQVREERLRRHDRRGAPRPSVHRPGPRRGLRGSAVLLDRRLVHRSHGDAGRDPRRLASLTVGFRFNDLASVGPASDHPGRIAASCSRRRRRSNRIRSSLRFRERCARRRRAPRLRRDDHRVPLAREGAQHVYGVRPDLSTFGKALGNGFAISALVRAARDHGAWRHACTQRAGVPPLDDARRRDPRARRGPRGDAHLS